VALKFKALVANCGTPMSRIFGNSNIAISSLAYNSDNNANGCNMGQLALGHPMV